MPLPALLAAGLIGLAIGVIGSDEAAKEEAEKERERHEEEKKAAWLEIAREHARLEAERRNMRTASAARFKRNEEEGRKFFRNFGTLGEDDAEDEDYKGCAVEDSGNDDECEEKNCGKSDVEADGAVRYVVSRRDGESEEEHMARVCALYAIGAYVGRFDPEADIDEYVLDEPERSDLIAELTSGVDFDTIMEKYLDHVAPDELRELDRIVRRMIFVEGESPKAAYDFYAYKWKPYLDARLEG